jgi:hypothetical protein
LHDGKVPSDQISEWICTAVAGGREQRALVDSSEILEIRESRSGGEGGIRTNADC